MPASMNRPCKLKCGNCRLKPLIGEQVNCLVAVQAWHSPQPLELRSCTIWPLASVKSILNRSVLRPRLMVQPICTTPAAVTSGPASSYVGSSASLPAILTSVSTPASHTAQPAISSCHAAYKKGTGLCGPQRPSTPWLTLVQPPQHCFLPMEHLLVGRQQLRLLREQLADCGLRSPPGEGHGEGWVSGGEGWGPSTALWPERGPLLMHVRALHSWEAHSMQLHVVNRGLRQQLWHGWLTLCCHPAELPCTASGTPRVRPPLLHRR